METKEYRRMFAIEANHWWYKSLHHLLVKTINSLRLPKTINILDAGCGTGQLSSRLQPLGRVVSFDYSALALKLAQKRHLSLLRASLNFLPFKSKKFDLITCISVLDQQSIDESRALRELHRVLKNKGTLILVVPAFKRLFSYHDQAIHAKKRYSKLEIVSLLKKSGFRLIHTRYLFSTLFSLFVIKRMLEKIFKNPAGSDLELPPQPINNLLHKLCLLEWRLTKKIPLPFGTSLLVIARAYKS